MNKIIHWLSNRLDGYRDIIQGINMVRRVGWVGQGPKCIPNDCVVIHFRHPSLAAKVLSLFPHNITPHSSIKYTN